MLKSEVGQVREQGAHVLEPNFLGLTLQLNNGAAAAAASLLCPPALSAWSVQSEVLAQVWPLQPASSVLDRCVTSV